MKDSVFEGVLLDLPLDSQNVEIVVSYSFKSNGSVYKGSVARFFPTKAEATFRREAAKIGDSVRRFGKDVEKAMGLIRGVEERTHKRLNKLEKQNDPDTAGG